MNKCEQVHSGGFGGQSGDLPPQIVTARREGCGAEVQGDDLGSCLMFVRLFRAPQSSTISNNIFTGLCCFSREQLFMSFLGLYKVQRGATLFIHFVLFCLPEVERKTRAC